ncbi:hypothetical protein AAIR98_001615 [Elusimicrobium simillimum]|uniref:hypothetical protein n=1 Tax=Elusimicrobium simillimum TaxID=3143438 RepID=UPI003C6FED55
MKLLIKNFKSINIYLKIIVVFCLIGFVKNFYLLFTQGPHVIMGYRLFAGFAIIFLSQAVFVTLKDWRAAFFSAAHCFFALFLYEDFTFLPVLKPVFTFFVYMTPFASERATQLLQYTMVSMLFSLEMLKTFTIYDYLKPKHEKKDNC